jgi:WD40 repeat protein
MEHYGAVNSAQFSPDGQRVVTASRDNTARLWDVPSMSGKDTAEDLLLFADLAEATANIALQTSSQEEILKVLTQRRSEQPGTKSAPDTQGHLQN